MDGDTRIITTAPGVEIAVRVAGSGPLVVLMHGWPELGRSWRSQIAPLAAAGFTVAAPDMRGYGGSSKPPQADAYHADASADDMAAVAQALGARRWFAVGHDWGAVIAWRCALRFPDQVAAVFSLSVPHGFQRAVASKAVFEARYPDRFFYIRYFQEQVGGAEGELERDVRRSLKTIFYALSGDAPEGEWLKPRPRDSGLLAGLAEPPPGPLSFMSDAELDSYTEQFVSGGFFGPVSWYRNLDRNGEQAQAYGDQVVRQPAGFLCGDREAVLAMNPHALDAQRLLCSDLRVEALIAGAGHWIQQERPDEVKAALIGFLRGVAGDLSRRTGSSGWAR